MTNRSKVQRCNPYVMSPLYPSKMHHDSNHKTELKPLKTLHQSMECHMKLKRRKVS